MAVRKERYWRCPCCDRSYTRRKNERRLFPCPVCKRPLVAARVLRSPKRCRHQRGQAQYRKWLEKDHSVPRTSMGLVLRPPPEVKRLWADVRKAKQRPTLIKRANVFLEALWDYAADHRRAGEDEWRVTYKVIDGRVEQRKHRGGMTSCPVLVDAELSYLLHGDYRRNLLKGIHEVRIDVRKHWNPELPLMDSLRSTIIHEVQHVLDALASQGDRGHDEYWRRRLERLYEIFPPSAYGTKLLLDADGQVVS